MRAPDLSAASESTASAHEYWQAEWASEGQKTAWSTPEPFVLAAVEHVRRRDGCSALDVGCGVGRHGLHLARSGFEVALTDASSTAIEAVNQEALAHQLHVDAREALMTEQPFSDSSFDLIVSWNVIYHGDRKVVTQVLAEIARLLRPGGCFVGNMLSTRSPRFGEGREVAPSTWIDAEGGGDLAHPHHYCDETDLIWLLSRSFHLLALVFEPPRPGSRSAHWNFSVERKR